MRTARTLTFFLVVYFYFCLCHAGVLAVANNHYYDVKPSDNPIVIVPGILGSQLWAKLNRTSVPFIFCEKKSDWFSLWLNIEELLYPAVLCAANNSMIEFDNVTKNYSNRAGVETRVPGWGGTDSVEFLDPARHDIGTLNYFHNMVDAFVSKGYERNQTIRAAPYDWRFGPDCLAKRGYYTALQDLIEETFYMNGKNKVTLITHSMGGPISLHFLTKVVDQEWKDYYIKQYITLSAVWAGAAKSVQSLTCGDNENIFIDKDIWGRASQRTYQSTQFLLPPPGDVWTNDIILVSTPERNYSSFEYKELFADLNYTYGWDMYQLVLPDLGNFEAPNITTYCFWGLLTDSHGNPATPERFVFTNEQFPDEPPTVINGPGDGTVNLRSLQICSRWKTKQKKPVHTKCFPGVEHVHMIKNFAVIGNVSEIVFSS